MNIFDTAWLFIGTIVSSAIKFEGGGFNSFNIETDLVGKAVPSSIKSYFPDLYERAVME